MCSICLAMQEESRGDRSLRGRRPSVTQTVAAICRTCLGEKGDASALNVVRMNNRDVLARVIEQSGYSRGEQQRPSSGLAVYQRITQIAPGALDAREKLARMQLPFNDVAGAKASLFAMSEVAPDKKPRDRIMDAFEALGSSRPV